MLDVVTTNAHGRDRNALQGVDVFDVDCISGVSLFGGYGVLGSAWTAKDPIGFSGGTTNLYEYAGNDPVNGKDPRGLRVMRCARVADLPGNELLGVEHHWLLTDTVEAGMGPANGGVPGVAGAGSDSPYVTNTTVNDHTGQSDDAGSVCEEIPDVDEDCVNADLALGRDTGRWSPINQCQTFVQEILWECFIGQTVEVDYSPNCGGVGPC